MSCDLVVRRFLKDWSGNSVHLHAEGNEGRHNEFLAKFQKTPIVITINAKVFQGSEKLLIQHIGKHYGLQKVTNFRGLAKKLQPKLDESSTFKCVFLVTNVEHLDHYKPLFVEEFMEFVSTNSLHLKLITLSTLSWKLVEGRLLNFGSRFATIAYHLSEFNISELNNLGISGVSENKMNPNSIPMLKAYLPKNLNPLSLRKLVAKQKPQDDDSFQRLPANVALTLISAYIATWNPKSTDQRFIGDKSTGKRRNQQTKAVREYHEIEAKPFILDRLENIYKEMKRNLLADNCGDFNVCVQIPILLQFGHLERVSDIQNLTQPKFRCSAPFDYVNKIFNEFVKNYTTRLSEKTTTEELRAYLYEHNEI